MTYKGFRNYSTWLVYHWLTQEPQTDKQLRFLAEERENEIKALAQEIEALVTNFNNPLSGQNSLYTAILQATFDEVDWLEIADKYNY